MHIGIAGHIATAHISNFLEGDTTLLPKGYSGGAPLLGTLIGEYLSRGYQVSAFTTSVDMDLNLTEPICAHGKNFKIYYCPQRKRSVRMNGWHLGRIVDLFKFERKFLERAIRKANPDVIHAHWTYEFSIAAMASEVPCLVTAHDDPAEVLRLYKNIYRFGRYLMARKVLHSAKSVTAVSPDLKRRISGVTSREIDVIPNPLGQSFIDASMCGSRRMLDANPRVISVINGWGHLKNASTALAAFKIVRNQIPGATYHLFGFDFQAGGPAETWSKLQGLDSGIVFHGPVPHATLIEALKDSTLMVHPSRTESFGMGIAEAMSCGLPVVGGVRSGGVPWMIGEAGVLVDIDEAHLIGNAVLHLLSNHVQYSNCVAAARLRVKEFMPELIANQYINKYTELINNASHTTCTASSNK